MRFKIVSKFVKFIKKKWYKKWLSVFEIRQEINGRNEIANIFSSIYIDGKVMLAKYVY